VLRALIILWGVTLWSVAILDWTHYRLFVGLVGLVR
jgi:hypothetical protein